MVKNDDDDDDDGDGNGNGNDGNDEGDGGNGGNGGSGGGGGGDNRDGNNNVPCLFFFFFFFQSISVQSTGSPLFLLFCLPTFKFSVPISPVPFTPSSSSSFPFYSNRHLPLLALLAKHYRPLATWFSFSFFF